MFVLMQFGDEIMQTNDGKNEKYKSDIKNLTCIKLIQTLKYI